MKLYHYSKKGNSVLQDGLLSFATSPNVNTRDYLKRMGSENKEEITKWLESCFEGRSRGIRFFTESILLLNIMTLKKPLFREAFLFYNGAFSIISTTSGR